MIPADIGGGGPIDVTPEDLRQVALAFARGQDRLDAVADALGSALIGAAGMAGDDKYGKAFAKSYDPAARALSPVLSAAVRAVGQAADGLVRTANNYLKADHHSDAKAGAGGPHLFPPPPVIADVMYPDPPSAIGPGSNHWPPPIDKYWPDGHQDRLRDAAAAYRKAAADLDDVGRDLHLQVQALTDNNSSASISAMAAFWGRIWQDCDAGGDAPLSTAHLACLRLAAVCEKFAEAIDHAHSEFEHKVSEAGLAIGVTTAVGVLGTIVTLGGSDAGAVALDAGEAAAIFATVDGVMDAAVADYAAEGISELETVLASAAEGVPEVEAVDAETTEVAQVLEREMADTEARQPVGVGGRGGGSEPPTGGEGPGGSADEPPPEEEPSGGRAAQNRGKQYENHLKEELDGGDSFREGGREFDGTFEENGQETWYEAKSGRFWEKAAEDPKVMAKFKSNLGDARRIALANGKEFCLISENPIPQDIIEWLIKKGYSWKIIPMG